MKLLRISCGIPTAIGSISPSPCIFEGQNAVGTAKSKAASKYSFVTDGRAIDLNTLRGQSLEQIRPGGLGLHLIRQAMDTVEFTRKGLINQLRLVKYFAQTSTAP
jgi:hypothetical protein